MSSGTVEDEAAGASASAEESGDDGGGGGGAKRKAADGWDRRAGAKKKKQAKSEEVDFWTPAPLYDALNAHYGPFTLDAAASAANAKVPGNYFSKDDDALARDWTGVVWCNPPYGRDTGASKGTAAWIRKAVDEVKVKGNATRVVMLVPGYTDLSYFHDIIFPHVSEIVCVKSRIKFDGPNLCAGFVFAHSPATRARALAHLKMHSGTARHPTAIYVFDKAPRSAGVALGSIYREGTGLTVRGGAAQS